ncbi:MAG: ATP-dependent dethiobiotin synthetase BioD [Candidatus Binataceae bacterium]|nr:ATP-dependent dethiobiotin synthetase BioD [Candidatus Binataceae bacterium]
MNVRYVITGTDTGVGKTVFAAALTLALSGTYFKPVQSGSEEETDTDVVRRLTALPSEHFLRECYRLRTPLSPHRAAEIDGVEIDADRLMLPTTDSPLIVEGAGGLHVPLTRKLLYIEVFARWGVPVILCTRTVLGTINHTLLSLEALRRRAIPIHGVVFIGGANPDNERTITEMGSVRSLGRMPTLTKVTPTHIADAFARNFRQRDFVE